MSFKDIKGQDIQISFLKKAIASSSVAHAYLFVGIDGVGKSLVATNFAKALNCEREEEDACDVCTSCRKIESRNHPDVFRITSDKAQKVIKIDSIRTLQERASLKPYEAKWKVFIIEDAHLMNSESANCLLKTLEEPPGRSLFILTTFNVSGLFRTIVSRCQIVKFPPLSFETIENILIKKFGFQKNSARFMSRLSGGGMNKRVLVEGEGFIAWKNRIIDEFMDGSFFQEESLMFSSPKSDMQEALLILIYWYRDMLICKNSFIEDSIINFDRIKDLKRFSKEFSCEDIDRRLNTLIDAHMAVDQNVNPKLIIGALI